MPPSARSLAVWLWCLLCLDFLRAQGHQWPQPAQQECTGENKSCSGRKKTVLKLQILSTKDSPIAEI